MDAARYEGRSTVASWQGEIEEAIDNVKRTNLGRWMRREWHKAAARDRWTARRKAKWLEWKRDRSPETSRGARGSVAQSMVWVKGHVPKEFLDWVERHWSHDGETRAVLSECCFEKWEREGWPKGRNRP